MPLFYQIVHNDALIVDVHENQSIGDQMTVSYYFSLLIPGVFGDDAFVPEGHKLDEIVEGFAYGRSRGTRHIRAKSYVRPSGVGSRTGAVDRQDILLAVSGVSPFVPV
jgi:hypothetical protein